MATRTPRAGRLAPLVLLLGIFQGHLITLIMMDLGWKGW